jgi:hypothetical protein
LKDWNAVTSALSPNAQRSNPSDISIQKVPKAAYVKAIRDARWLSRPMNGVLSGEAAVGLNFLRARFIAHTVGWSGTSDFYHIHS